MHTNYKRNIHTLYVKNYEVHEYEGSELNGTQWLMVYANYVSSVGKNTNAIKKNTEPLLGSSTEVRLEVNAEKTKSPECRAVSRFKDR
jgi:hypothetical protein